MVMIVPPRIQQSGPENMQAEDWARKLNYLEGENQCNSSDTCNRPFHNAGLLEVNISGGGPGDDAMSAPPLPPAPVDYENRRENGSPRYVRRSSYSEWRCPEHQDGDGSSSSSSSNEDYHEFRKYRHPHDRPSEFLNPPSKWFSGFNGPPHCPPPPYRHGWFGHGKPCRWPSPPPPYDGFQHHGPPHHPPKHSQHYDHHGPPHHRRHHGPPHPPKHPHHGGRHGPPHHGDHDGPPHHGNHRGPPHHGIHHGPPHHPPKHPHHGNHHGPPHHRKHHGPPHHSSPPPHAYAHHGPPHHPPPPPPPPAYYDHHGLPHDLLRLRHPAKHH